MHNDDISNLPEILRKNLNESVQPTVVALGGIWSRLNEFKRKNKTSGRC